MSISKREYHKAYYLANKERLLQGMRDWKAMNKERDDLMGKRWLDKNRAHHNAYQREYRRKKKEAAKKEEANVH